uniref:DM2 domain-containing protein n=1 Tax=Sphenodon punctatus TaxID=8508 RepID=A0A8D0L888_SPHPU
MQVHDLKISCRIPHPHAESPVLLLPAQSFQPALGRCRVCPKPRLLKILQAAGAQGETFTLKEVIHYLGQYIMLRELYDKQQQHMVYCGGDVLWELMELETFSVKDPSPVYDMLKRNVTASVVTGRFLIV